jgi:response regulator RpfG family c-di-GMP phosphodiesterase
MGLVKYLSDYKGFDFSVSHKASTFENIKEKKILLLEDQFVNYLFLKELFNTVGAVVIRALSFEQSLKIVHLSHEIDLIITNDTILNNANKGMVDYVIHETNVPLIMICNQIQSSSRILAESYGIKFIASMESDSRHLCEVVSDALNKKVQIKN